MFCPKCGTENPDRGKFCRQCGTDLAPVSEALAGKIPVQMQGFEAMREIQSWNKKGRPITYEQAITKIFSGIAFLIVAAVLGITSVAGGQFWWFWMLIPAFGSLGSGVAQLVHLKKLEKYNSASFAAQNAQNAFQPSTRKTVLPSPSAQLDEIYNLINSGNKIEAIKVYRETYGTGLKEAKEAVELLERRQTPMAIPQNYRQPPQTSIYDTGELAVPPSVVESTTRHLEMNSEGETMTLPKK